MEFVHPHHSAGYSTVLPQATSLVSCFAVHTIVSHSVSTCYGLFGKHLCSNETYECYSSIVAGGNVVVVFIVCVVVVDEKIYIDVIKNHFEFIFLIMI